MNPIYWDYNATTPLDPHVRQAMEPYLENVWGNPSSVHAVGRQARAALDEFRYRLAGAWKCRPSEVIFTSGGTESNNLAVLGTARLGGAQGRRHLVASPVEHHAVVQSMADSVGSSSSPPIKKQKTANDELWQLAVTWMSGKTWQFEMSCTSTLGELRRRVMLASGS